MSNLHVDLGEFYERAKRVARAAVAGSPNTSYGLEDVAPEIVWHSVGSSPLTSFVPVHATLNGCVDALTARQVSAADVAAISGPPPNEMAVTASDMTTARSWLVQSLAQKLDENSRQHLIDEQVVSHGWIGDAVRVTSLVLALVIVAGAAADR